MLQKINLKKILLFVAIAYFLCVVVAIMLHFIQSNISDKITTIIIAVAYMPTPAISAFVVQKLIYKEKLKKYGLTFYKKAIKNYLYLFLIFTLIILLTTLVIYLLGNVDAIKGFGKIDFSKDFFSKNLAALLKQKGVDMQTISVAVNSISKIPPFVFYILMTLQGVIIGGILNIPIMFGEEFGWRGLLLYETKSLGFWKSSLLIGFIWGIWHLPLVLFFGLNYPEHPYIGSLMMILFTLSLSPIFNYARLKTKSILGSCLLHGMFNGTAGIFVFFVADGNDLLGSLSGIAGILSILFISAIIFYRDKKFIRHFNDYFDD
jgi:membrane protease YdiL (CAAX protease family)